MYNKKNIIDHMLSFVDFKNSKAFLDIGCGKGKALREIGNRVNNDVKLYGIDVMDKSIEFAKSQSIYDKRFSYEVYNIEDGLKFANNSLDVILCCNVLECIINKKQLLKEIHRILKPSGMVIMSHFDWDTQVFNAKNKTLYRKIIHTYNDWQQPWMNECDAWMGRRISGVFNDVNLFVGNMYSYVLSETEYKEGTRGYSLINDELKALVDNNLIEKSEYNEFHTEISELRDKGHYFYSINMYTYAGRKKEI